MSSQDTPKSVGSQISEDVTNAFGKATGAISSFFKSDKSKTQQSAGRHHRHLSRKHKRSSHKRKSYRRSCKKCHHKSCICSRKFRRSHRRH